MMTDAAVEILSMPVALRCSHYSRLRIAGCDFVNQASSTRKAWESDTAYVCL
jgi:hypothetical protein